MRRLLAAHPINRGLSGWWTFLDGAAPIVDISPRARLAIGANNPTRSGSRVGRLGTLSSSSYYVAPDRPGDISRYSYVFWVRGTTTPANYAGILARTSTPGGSNITNSIQVYSSNVRIYHDQNVDPPVDTGITVASLLDGKLHCVGIAYDGATIYAYRDGLLVGSAGHSTQGTPKTGAGDLLIGIERGRTSGYAWNNQIGNIREWRRVLSADEFRRLNAYPWLGGAEPSRRRALKAGSGGASYSLALDAGTFSLTGQALALKHGRRLPLSNGSFALTGQALALKRGFRLSLSNGAFVLTGQSLGLRAQRRLALAAGSVALAGQAVALRYGRRLALGTGSYALSGQALALRAARRLALAAGSFALTGQAVDLIKGGRRMLLDAATFGLTGQNVALRVGRRLPLAAGAVALTGQSVALLAGRRLALAAGSVALTGQSLRLLRGYLLAGGVGLFTLSGQAIALIYSGAGAAVLRAPAARTYTWRDRPRRAAWQTGPRAAAWLDRPRRVDWRDAEMPATVFQLRPQHVDDDLDHGFVFTAFGADDDVASYTVTAPGAITHTASRSGQTVTVRIQGTAGTHRIVVHAVADSGQEATIEADIVISDPS